jgi:hypothetical protein
MPTPTFNLGMDCSVVVISPVGGRVDLSIVEAFNAKQQVHKIRVRPLNGPPQGADVPDGWEGTFSIERGSPAADNLFSQIEAGFWAGGVLNTGQLYQYVDEVGGGTSTYTFNNVTMSLSDAGTWKSDSSVKQTIAFFASTRTAG